MSAFEALEARAATSAVVEEERMALQNRVRPTGELVAVESRAATLMGNRGCLHDEDKRVVRNSGRKAWVSCLLQFEGIRRNLMTPGHYTELFFLDEPTALAAGHRPCFTCRRQDAKRFMEHWRRGNQLDSGVTDIDGQLRTQGPRSGEGSATGLPDGTVVRDESTGELFALRSGRAFRWSFDGYDAAVDATRLGDQITIITPHSIVAALADGYRPAFHPSAS